MDLIGFSEFKKKYERKKVEEVPNEASLNPKISICIQTFQHVNYIKDCLNGILNQKTNFEYEILLGEDNSTDGTREICIDYARKNPDKIRLFLHHRDNNLKIDGSPTGRFILMYNCYSSRGKYIALCEGDDYWTDPLKLQMQVDFLEQHHDHIACFTNAEILDEINNESRIYNEYIKNHYKITDIIKGSGSLFPTASLVFRNKILEYPDFIFKAKAGDRALALILALQGDFFLLNETTCVYRKHPGGIFTSIINDNDKRLEIDKNNIKLLNSFNKYTKGKYKEVIKKAISKRSFISLIRNTNDLRSDKKSQLYKNLNFADWIRLIKEIIKQK